MCQSPGRTNQALETCPCSRKAACGPPVWMPSSLLEGWSPSEWKGKQRHFSSSSTSHPGAIPPMSHPVIPPWPNIVPKAKEAAALCGWAREGPGGGGVARTRGPGSPPVAPSDPSGLGQISGPLSHKRREVGETEGLTHRQWDHFLLGEGRTRSRRQTGQGALPLGLVRQMRPRSRPLRRRARVATRPPACPPSPAAPRARPGPRGATT